MYCLIRQLILFQSESEKKLITATSSFIFEYFCFCKIKLRAIELNLLAFTNFPYFHSQDLKIMVYWITGQGSHFIAGLICFKLQKYNEVYIRSSTSFKT